jgi:hypothetical protein
MVPLKLRIAPGRNRSKRKHDKKLYTYLEESGGLYRRKFNNKRKARDETGSETSSEPITPLGGAARRGPAPRGGVVPSVIVSYPFPSHNFPYLIKTTKI